MSIVGKLLQTQKSDIQFHKLKQFERNSSIFHPNSARKVIKLPQINDDKQGKLIERQFEILPRYGGGKCEDF